MAATSALTRDSIFQIARTLPATPKVLAGLGELFHDINVGLDEVADLIKRDVALTARIIRISNSIVYGGSIRIGALEEALNRVGFSEVHRLVGLITSNLLADRPLVYYGVMAEPLREHMLFTALACEALAEECGHRFAQRLYDRIDAHDRHAGARSRGGADCPRSRPTRHGRQGSYLVWEGIVFGLSNSEVAAMILTDWHFPPEILSARCASTICCDPRTTTTSSPACSTWPGAWSPRPGTRCRATAATGNCRRANSRSSASAKTRSTPPASGRAPRSSGCAPSCVDKANFPRALRSDPP
jgi:hypothetical protein